jgi:hypothetical protein
MNTRYARDPACASNLQFDRYLAGELEPGRAVELERHLGSCARCTATFDTIRRGAEAFSRELPAAIASRVRAEVRARSAQRWWHWCLPLAAASAVAALIWAGAGGTIDSSTEQERTKGGARARFYVMHDGIVRPGSDGERVQAGDSIEFAYSSDRELYLAIVSIDGAQHASVYYDASGRAAKIERARDAALDRSTVLDATLGAETVYVLFCEHPIEIAPLTRALERAPERAVAADGCTTERHTLFKVAR